MTFPAKQEGAGKTSKISDWNLGGSSEIYEVKEEGRVVELEKCTVEFLSGCFFNTETVTIAVETNKTNGPKDKGGITSILYIKAKNLQKPATVKMKICNSDGMDDEFTDLRYYDEREMVWKHHSNIRLDGSGFIKFETYHSSRWLGTALYKIRPILYAKANQFVVAIVQDIDSSLSMLDEDIKEDYGSDIDKKTADVIKCEKNTTVESRVTCISRHAFLFIEDGVYSHDNFIGKLSYGSCLLKSDQYVENISIRIKVAINIGAANSPKEYFYTRKIQECGTKNPVDDKFIREILPRFDDIEEFVEFARLGLGIKSCQQPTTQEDEQYIYLQKMATLRLWKQREGQKATPVGLSQALDKYVKVKQKKLLRQKFYEVARRFRYCFDWMEFTTSSRGLNLSQRDINAVARKGVISTGTKIYLLERWAEATGEEEASAEKLQEVADNYSALTSSIKSH